MVIYLCLEELEHLLVDDLEEPVVERFELRVAGLRQEKGVDPEQACINNNTEVSKVPYILIFFPTFI